MNRLSPARRSNEPLAIIILGALYLTTMVPLGAELFLREHWGAMAPWLVVAFVAGPLLGILFIALVGALFFRSKSEDGKLVESYGETVVAIAVFQFVGGTFLLLLGNMAGCVIALF